MKILDRYVLSTFLKNYLISLRVLIGLYVVLDMVFNFDELAEVQSKTAGAGGVASVLERTSLKLSRTSVTLCVPHREDALAGDAVRRRLQRLADALGRDAEVATFI